MPEQLELVIEPKRGMTYNGAGSDEPIAVYGYGVYPRSSVLAGQTKRVFIDSFETVEAAQKAYPTARVSESSLFQPPSLDHLPDDGDDDMDGPWSGPDWPYGMD